MVLEENNDGSDVFWPGYVDAVTNLVLNLLFMLTIMIVAVFMFALELSRNKDMVPKVNVPTTQEKLATDINSNSTENLKAKDEKIVALERQIENLRQQVQSNDLQNPAVHGSRSTQKIVIVKTPLTSVDKNLSQSTGVIVHFLQEGVTLTEAEANSVRKALADIASKGGARIVVDVPVGFTEAKRLGFYRAMAVRNQLIELKVPADKIDVSVREGQSSSDNAKVLVMEP